MTVIGDIYEVTFLRGCSDMHKNFPSNKTKEGYRISTLFKFCKVISHFLIMKCEGTVVSRIRVFMPKVIGRISAYTKLDPALRS